MGTAARASAATRADPAALFLTAGLGGQFALLALLWATVGLGPAGLAAGIACAVLVCAAYTRGLHRTPAGRPGPADFVTLARAVLSCGVTALVTDHLIAGYVATGLLVTGAGGPAGDPQAVPPQVHAVVPALVVIASIALLLDAVDGQVARRTGTVSALGARFDMEVDAFLILVLSMYVATSLGWWVLAIGAMRYAFVAASWPLPWLRGALPHSRARKVVAALQGVLLVVAASGVLPPAGAMAVAGTALATLCWSFGRDVHWLWRHQVTAEPPAIAEWTAETTAESTAKSTAGTMAGNPAIRV